MSRPRRLRRILEEPQIRCFKPEGTNMDSLESVKITIDEFEAIRLRDYHNIQQKRSAEVMGISQPTFHRILSSARKKISKALIEGTPIIIIGDDFITDKERYICAICGFKWLNPGKEYHNCPDCQSEDIKLIKNDSHPERTDPTLILRKSYGGQGMGAGPPLVCKCPNCGYESRKKRGVPCKNTTCPQCKTPLCGVN